MEINYLAVGLAALAAFFLGFIWYTIIFSKPWQKLIGMGNKGTGVESTNETPNMGRLLASSFALNLLMAFALAAFVGASATWISGLVTGLIAGFGFVALALGTNYMFAGKPFKLWLIDAGHYTVVFAAMGLIIGAM